MRSVTDGGSAAGWGRGAAGTVVVSNCGPAPETAAGAAFCFAAGIAWVDSGTGALPASGTAADLLDGRFCTGTDLAGSAAFFAVVVLGAGATAPATGGAGDSAAAAETGGAGCAGEAGFGGDLACLPIRGAGAAPGAPAAGTARAAGRLA